MTAETADPSADDAHISFAKRLAHNNKETRGSALRKLKRWLVTKSKQGTLDDSEIIKIWKGLHYSMWYSDRPLVQEALALDISQIVTLIPDTEDSVKFFGGFCQTIAREWAAIDKLRLDKFYMFIRTALKSVLEFCADKSWEPEVVASVVSELDSTIINSESCPTSISVYISEHFLTLYSEVATVSTPPLFITKLLMCYITTLSMTPKKDLSRVIMTNLFNPITENSVSVKLDLQMLSAHIQELAVKPDILTRNRKLLYKLRNDLTIAIDGDLSNLSPLGKHKLEENSLSNGAIAGELVSEPNKKKKKKSEIKSISEKGLNGDSTVAAEFSNGSEADAIMDGNAMDSVEVKEPTKTKPKKKKKKAKAATDVATAAEPDVALESKPDVAIETKPNVATVTKPDVAIETKPDVAIETKPDVAIETKPDVAIETKPDVAIETKPDVAIETKPDVAIETKPDVAIETKPDVALETKPDVALETKSSECCELPLESENVTDLVESSDVRETVQPDVSPMPPNDAISTDTNGTGDAMVASAENSEATTEITEAINGSPDDAANITDEAPSLEETSVPSETSTPVETSTLTSDSVNDTSDRQPIAEPIVEQLATPIVATPNASKSPVRRKSERKKRRKSVEKTPTVATSTPNTAPTNTSSAKKKVRMSMENNQTYFFKKNASLESPVPFDSTRTPSKGVLKTSPAVTRSRTKQGRGRSRVKK